MGSLKFVNTSIGFTELKDEISLLIQISNCGGKCGSCHSPHLRGDIGEEIQQIYHIVDKYKDNITAICFLGHGNNELKDAFMVVLNKIKIKYPMLKIGLYSGYSTMVRDFIPLLDYYKVGGYNSELGGLDSSTTNQVMYKKIEGNFLDITREYQEKSNDN